MAFQACISLVISQCAACNQTTFKGKERETMQIKAYTCPSCGAPLDVNYDTQFTFCPHCGCKLHMVYPK